ncbi:pyridine nucleotide-disulfide oxidoreductase domain-containing protein 1-like isoform X2 [Oppia nitens]|uniref:pyridine nucleotide-disulfide oxidoreductase domain-containing protein 1-like isoform X2 n=1 Tax=Oppia nitens TaxID=1686743 RepID=UPI0023DC51FD|nr:pyridine nucleotide-disulfide oxidoreductase domain-containing protein 1-like isoform X2 [Oppia nitens]
MDQVIGLNAQRHELTLKKMTATAGKTLIYDKLCICLGAKPKMIDIRFNSSCSCDDDDDLQLINDHIVVIRDTQTVREFTDKLKNANRVVIVGNGGIASELVHHIRHCQLIWCIKDQHMSAPYLDPLASEFFARQLNDITVSSSSSNNSNNNSGDDVTDSHEKLPQNMTAKQQQTDQTLFGTGLGPDSWQQLSRLKGADHRQRKSVRIETKCEVQSIANTVDDRQKSRIVKIDDSDDTTAQEWPIYVELTNGRIFGCNLVVSAIGVVPNTDAILLGNNFAIGAEGGLIVNNQMLTSEPDVYAAGDCCSVAWHPANDRWFQMRLWSQARQMGCYSALCIAADIHSTSAEIYFNFELFSHLTYLFDRKVVLLGQYNWQNVCDHSQCKTLVKVTEDNKQLIKVVLNSDHRMIGAILVGDTELEETFENLILNQLDLSCFGDQLLDINVDIDDYFD